MVSSYRRWVMSGPVSHHATNPTRIGPTSRNTNVADPPKPRTTTAESTAANSRAAIGAMARVTSPGGATHIAARTPATIAIPAATYGSGSPHEPATRPATSI